MTMRKGPAGKGQGARRPGIPDAASPPPQGRDLLAGVRLAVEDMTARVSDLGGDTVGMADELWDGFVSRLLARPGAEEGQELAQRLLGYREASLALVLELARARAVSPVEIMRAVGTWMSACDR